MSQELTTDQSIVTNVCGCVRGCAVGALPVRLQAERGENQAGAGHVLHGAGYGAGVLQGQGPAVQRHAAQLPTHTLCATAGADSSRLPANTTAPGELRRQQFRHAQSNDAHCDVTGRASAGGALPQQCHVGRPGRIHDGPLRQDVADPDHLPQSAAVYPGRLPTTTGTGTDCLIQ